MSKPANERHVDVVDRLPLARTIFVASRFTEQFNTYTHNLRVKY